MQNAASAILEAQQRPSAAVPVSADAVSGRRDRLCRATAINDLTVTEYEHFVSFCARDDSGAQILLQYRRDQVWLDEIGVWQIGAAQEPFYVWRSAPSPQPRSRVCPAISRALADTATGQTRD